MNSPKVWLTSTTQKAAEASFQEKKLKAHEFKNVEIIDIKKAAMQYEPAAPARDNMEIRAIQFSLAGASGSYLRTHASVSNSYNGNSDPYFVPGRFGLVFAHSRFGFEFVQWQFRSVFCARAIRARILCNGASGSYFVPEHFGLVFAHLRYGVF